MQVILSISVWTVGTALTIALWCAMLFFSVILYPFDKQRKVAHAQCYWWADALTSFNPFMKVCVRGLEGIDRSRTYVIVANHQSLADIIVLYKLKMQFKWVSKESLFNVPFIGWNLSLAKHIKLERGDFSSIKKVYREAATWLRGDMSVLFFPEGTRSDSGELKEFQNGAFKLAIKEKRPVLPVYLDGTYDAIPKGSWLFAKKAVCTIWALPAIETTSFGPGDFDRLRDEAHLAFEKAKSDCADAPCALKGKP